MHSRKTENVLSSYSIFSQIKMFLGDIMLKTAEKPSFYTYREPAWAVPREGLWQS